jgi:hypothetical protein
VWNPVAHGYLYDDCRRLVAKEAAFGQRFLSFGRPQGCIRAGFELLAQARRLIKAEQALTGVVNAGS